MSTQYSKEPVKYRMADTQYPKDEYSTIEWEYNNTSDALTIMHKDPLNIRDGHTGDLLMRKDDHQVFCPESAEAWLKALLDWDERINDSDIMRGYLDRRMKTVTDSFRIRAKGLLNSEKG